MGTKLVFAYAWMRHPFPKEIIWRRALTILRSGEIYYLGNNCNCFFVKKPELYKLITGNDCDFIALEPIEVPCNEKCKNKTICFCKKDNSFYFADIKNPELDDDKILIPKTG